MKCYFALSDNVSNRDDYYYMFECSLESAKRNTTLDLHCLFDYRKTYTQKIEDDRIYQLLLKYNVTIHICSIDFESELLNVYTDDYLKEINVTKSSLYSRFLRFMIADIEKDDEYIFYVDTDVIFLKDIKIDDFKKLPNTIAVCPEFVNSYHYQYFNAGIMLINMKSYKWAKKELINLLKQEIKAKIECCDQGYLNTIYENNFLKLKNIYNWKSYWGINNRAVIIHLHGFKPNFAKEYKAEYAEWISYIMYKNKKSYEGCKYYFNLFTKYSTSENNKYVIPNLTKLLDAQNTRYFLLFNRIIRKLKKICKLN